MPTLLRSSETMGCGATIKLGNGEVVWVSIARVGVLVRHSDMSGGFFKTFLNSFLGATHKCAQAAIALRLEFPEQAPELPRFKNPVLSSFANVIWHCKSAAAVSIVLNEAAAKLPAEEMADAAALLSAFEVTKNYEPPKRQSKMTSGTYKVEKPQAPKTVDEVISAYGALIEKHPAAIMDVAMLPVPKKQMKVLLKSLYAKATTTELQNHIEVGFTLLSLFQEGVGPTLIYPVIPGDKPAQADFAKFDKWLAWHTQSTAEGEALLAEWKRFLVGEPRSSLTPATTDHAEALFKKGDKYMNGKGVTENCAEAAKWYRQAAEQGHARAQSQLGLMYVIGEGVPQDFTEAARWCRAAAELAVAAAQCQLGDMYIKGQGVVQDDVEAATWCRKAAEQGNAMAQMLLGAMYHNGQGVPRDYVQAQMWLTLAAAGFPPSMAASRETAGSLLTIVGAKMTEPQIAQAQRLAREWNPERYRSDRIVR